MSANRPGYQLTTRSFPSQGARAVQIIFDMAASVIYESDLFLELTNGHIDFIQSVKIDNSQNPAQFTLQLPGLGEFGDRVICPPFTQGCFPVFVPISSKCDYHAASSGGVSVTVDFFNIELPYGTWSVLASNAPSAQVTGIETNFSAACTGGDQIAIPANPKAIRRVVQNPAANANSVWIQFANAAVGDWHSQELLPGQEFDTNGGPLITGALHLIGTIGDHFYASELSSQ